MPGYKALSIMQPWAWLVVSGIKDVENRSWNTLHRGPLLIHAAMKMDRSNYEACRRYAYVRGVELPPMGSLERGGIVGLVTLQEVFKRNDAYCKALGSVWYEDGFGWHMVEARPLPFTRCRGQLRLFEPEVIVAGLD